VATGVAVGPAVDETICCEVGVDGATDAAATFADGEALVEVEKP
jgi:hypothetical protein